GKAEVCKTFITGSTPVAASIRPRGHSPPDRSATVSLWTTRSWAGRRRVRKDLPPDHQPPVLGRQYEDRGGPQAARWWMHSGASVRVFLIKWTRGRRERGRSVNRRLS